MQQFCQGSTSGFRDMLSYQNYKISEVGSGISIIITVNNYLPQHSRTLTIFYFLSYYYVHVLCMDINVLGC